MTTNGKSYKQRAHERTVKDYEARIDELKARILEVENELKETEEGLSDQAKISMRLIWGMELLGIPSIESEFYEACVVNAAFRLGRLQIKPPEEKTEA